MHAANTLLAKLPPPLPSGLAALVAGMAPLVPGKTPAETTVVVAMSGGVDSSCVAALCAAAGYQTIGMTLQLWDYSSSNVEKKGSTCCALDDVYDARRVCQTVGIPHYVLNMESAFKGAVIDDFVATYLDGATPIPCVRCNQRIKFRELLDRAKSLGADVLVTGHYVLKVTDDRGHPALKLADDLRKDQSYYLFTTTPEQLAFLEFPLGHFTKPQVRELAKAFGLHVHVKKDSYDICFVPGGDYRAVVKKFAPQAEQAGEIILRDGTVIGTHDGIVGFTVGQRRGIGGGFAVPMFVTAVDAATNRVTIGPKEELGRSLFHLREVNWLGEPLPMDDAQPGLPVIVKVRAQHAGAVGSAWQLADDRLKIVLAAPEDQVSPGQAGVLYTPAGLLLGGGWIESFTGTPPVHLPLPTEKTRVAIV